MMNKTLSTDIDLFAAALSQTYVIVSKNEMLEYAGLLREYNEDSVKINDTWFSRNLYEFHVITPA
ncbi:hypothetical protein [Paenibacillus sp. SI8]|uniref:hypothetical protein n=1 Tax=unclassified Paenibacillus TaxID=185978 RepID=UPI0034668608